MEERRIEYLPLDDVPSALKNPKQHDDELLDASFGRFGVVDIPVVDERTGRLVSGHGRRDTILRARERGDDPPDGVVVADDGTWQVPVVRGWSSTDDEDAHAAGVAMNRASEAGGWDDRELTELLRDLNDHDPLAGLVGTGYDEMILTNLVMVTRSASELPDFNAAAEWVGLPDYEPEERPWKLVLSFGSQADREEFLDRFGVRSEITFTLAHKRTVSACYPKRDELLHDTGLVWQDPDDPPVVWDGDLAPLDPSPLAAPGVPGVSAEGSLDGPLSGSDTSLVEGSEDDLAAAQDPAHGSLRASGPDLVGGEGSGDQPGETAVQGSEDAAQVEA